LAAASCQRRARAPDGSRNLRDRGVSAWHGVNALTGNLRTSLTAVESARVGAHRRVVRQDLPGGDRAGLRGRPGAAPGRNPDRRGEPGREFGPEAIRSLGHGALETQLVPGRASEATRRPPSRVARRQRSV